MMQSTISHIKNKMPDCLRGIGVGGRNNSLNAARELVEEGLASGCIERTAAAVNGMLTEIFSAYHWCEGVWV